MPPEIELSVILPAFNEEKEIQGTIAAVEQALKDLKVSYEIVVVDDGSGDRTLAMAQQRASSRVRVLSYEPNRGKGYAVRHGMVNTSGRYRVFMDIDLSTSLEAVGRFLNIMRRGEYNIVIGDRKSNVASQKVRQPWMRRFLGRGFTLLSCLFIGKYIEDFTCGFKMFDQKSVELVFMRQLIFNWAFDTELLYIALLHNLRIGQEPVTWSHHADSTVRPFNNIVTSLTGLAQMKWNALTGRYR